MALRKTILVLIAALFPGIALGGTVVRSASGSREQPIEVRDGRLSGDAAATLAGVLGKIGRASGVEIVVFGSASQAVRLSFRDVPLEHALRELLRDTSFAFVYSPVGPAEGAAPPAVRLAAVHVYPRPGPSGSPGVATVVTASEAEPDPLDRVLLEAASPIARSEAAAALGSPEAADAVPALGQAILEDADSSVRESAARALGGTWSGEAVEPLSASLSGDVDPSVREAAAAALGKTWDERAVAPLAEALVGDASPAVREAAAAALARTWSDDAVQPLAVAARSDSSAQVRETAAQALRSIEGDEEAG